MAAERLPFLAVAEDQVLEFFRRFDLLDEQVKLVSGWFRESLKEAPIEQLALLRLDADLYESTLEALIHLYPKVSSGGWVIIDDYQMLPPCRKAVDQYRHDQRIDAPIQAIDRHAVCWRVP
jgi:hypothetical protein